MRSLLFFLKHPQQILSAFLMKYGKYVPDKIYLAMQYRIRMGRKLNLSDPKTFTEKLQWLKLYNRKPICTIMVDKYAVKDFVAQRIGNQYVIPTIGVWSSLEEVAWENLPDKFVLKTTHGGGGTGVVIVKDKLKVNKDQILRKLKWSFNDEGFTRNREWPYKNVPRRILAEKFIESSEDPKIGLMDYKFFCFNGVPKFFKVDFGRFVDHHANYYSIDGKLLPFGEANYSPIPTIKIDLPENFDKMLIMARTLSEGFPFLRVDLYNVNGIIYFGELTFFPASGLEKWTDDSVDIKLGDLLDLD